MKDRARSSSASTRSSTPDPIASGLISRVNPPVYPRSLSRMRRLSSGIVPSPSWRRFFSSVLSDIWICRIVFPSRVKVFRRSTPLSGSTFAIERVVYQVIFFTVSGRASPYSATTKSQVFGGAFWIEILRFRYLACIVVRYSPNHPLSRSRR